MRSGLTVGGRFPGFFSPFGTRVVMRRSITTGAPHRLCDFVQRNTFLPAYFNKLDEMLGQSDKTLRLMRDVLCNNQFNVDVFNQIASDNDAIRKILYLLERKRVPYWQGITLYQYLIAAAQFTKILNLNERDNGTKSSRIMFIAPLAKDGKLTDVGIEYVDTLCYFMHMMTNIELSGDALIQYILQSSSIDQHICQIEILPQFHEDPVDEMMQIMKKNMPLFVNAHSRFCNIPSAALMNHFFLLINKNPLLPRPMLGSISLESLAEMHLNGLHPLPLYSQDIKSNITTVHGRFCGALPALMHDWGHLFWANLMTPSERDMILNRLVPMLRHLHDGQQNNPRFQDILKRICIGLFDFDLSGKLYFESIDEVVFLYISKVLDKELYPGGNIISISPDDRAVLFSALKEFIASEKKFAGSLSKSLQMLCHAINVKSSLNNRLFSYPLHESGYHKLADASLECSAEDVTSVRNKQ